MFYLDFNYNLVLAWINQLDKPKDSVFMNVITLNNTVSINKQ